jgi:protein TonB
MKMPPTGRDCLPGASGLEGARACSVAAPYAAGRVGGSGRARADAAGRRRRFPLGAGLAVSLTGHILLLLLILWTGGRTWEQSGPTRVIRVELVELSGGPASGGGRPALGRSPAGPHAGGAAPRRTAAAAAVPASAKVQAAPREAALRDRTAAEAPAPSARPAATTDAAASGDAPGEHPPTDQSSGGPAAGGGSARVGSGPSGAGAVSGGGGMPGGATGESVDRLPRILEKVKPAYPEQARRLRRTGVVTLRFLVDAEGRVRQPKVVEAAPAGLFEDSALAAVRRWRFAPAMRQGRPVAVWLILPVRFTLETDR